MVCERGTEVANLLGKPGPRMGKWKLRLQESAVAVMES